VANDVYFSNVLIGFTQATIHLLNSKTVGGSTFGAQLSIDPTGLNIAIRQTSTTTTTARISTTGMQSFTYAFATSGNIGTILGTFHMGSGVPASTLGANGDWYFRTNSAVTTCLYKKYGTAWHKIV
jgi:hypothetical protein